MSACHGCGTELPPKAWKWCSERCRKAQYGGTCEDCGAPTCGHDGPANAPTRCDPCSHARQHAGRRWTPETIIAAIQQWADEHGGIPPVASDWNSTLTEAKHGSPRAPEYPSVNTVAREFDSWTAAITAAGFDAFAVGHYGRDGEYPEVIAETIALYRSGLSCESVGVRMGVSETAVRCRLINAGEPRRSCNERRQVAA